MNTPTWAPTRCKRQTERESERENLVAPGVGELKVKRKETAKRENDNVEKRDRNFRDDERRTREKRRKTRARVGGGGRGYVGKLETVRKGRNAKQMG